jgi:hypothetical protein
LLKNLGCFLNGRRAAARAEPEKMSKNTVVTKQTEKALISDVSAAF